MTKAVTRTKEQKFYNALKDVFVGAEVEGESGYINLMRIKSRYFEKGVSPKLQQDIEDALKPFPEFRGELFDKLYTFFSRYFSESGSIYFRYTPLHQNVYEKVYTDDKDVMLFWKTHMLYYVMTDRLFKNLEVEIPSSTEPNPPNPPFIKGGEGGLGGERVIRFFFDISHPEHKKANEKREIIYEFKEERKDGTLVFTVAYSEKGRKTRVDEILKALRKQGVKVGEEVLERAFRVFDLQSEVDYFINKNAKAFLQEQFNLWLYQYMFSGESEWTETRIKQLRTLKDIAFKIIDFISQFEDELVKVWNKPKFVLNSNYVITLDRIANPPSSPLEKGGQRGIELVERLLAHKNFKAQVEEWQALGIVKSDFKTSDVIEEDLTGQQLSARYRYLPIDTKHFKDLELEILGLFDNLDQALDGWLIKSENYQALNTLLPKFREKVKVIYIDPPYNTGNDEFNYNDRFRHSSWLTMMGDRLKLARHLMREDGAIFVSIDDHEVANLRLVMDEVFGKENRVESFIWKKSYGGGAKEKFAVTQHEYVLLYARSLEQTAELWLPPDPEAESKYYKYRDSKFETRGPYRLKPLEATKSMDRRENLIFPIPLPDGGEVWPKKQWWWSHERVMHALEEDELVFTRQGDHITVSYKQYLRDEKGRQRGAKPFFIIDGIYTQQGTADLTELFYGQAVIQFPKPIELMKKLITMEIDEESGHITLDFFAGSGTTAHAVINLNRQDGGRRKYMLVEMADYFESVLLPRIKKVVFCEKWKDGKPAGGRASVTLSNTTNWSNTKTRCGRRNTRTPICLTTPIKTPTTSMRSCAT